MATLEALSAGGDAARRRFWRRHDVTTLDVDPKGYVELFERRLAVSM